jgi:hypothetical protein
MRAFFTPIVLAAGVLAAVGMACNALSGIDDFEVASGSDAEPESGGESGSFDGASSSGGNPDATGDSEAHDGTTEAGDAADETSTDGRTPDGAAEASADALADAAADTTAPPADGGIVDADAAGDASNEVSTPQDAAAEADAPASDGGCAVSAPVCDGGCAIAHSDGFGHTFYDCTPWGTMNETQALEACTAYTGSATACANDPIGCANADEVCTTGTSACVCWTYTGMHTGKVFASTTATCSCYVSPAPSWN